MAIVKPFKGIRPPKDLVEQVESRPYDVLNSEEARAEAGDNEKSLYHIIKPEINFEPGTSEYDPRVYESAAENFRKFQENGWLKQDDKELYYIYAQTMNGKTQYGLVVGAYVNDYMTGVIKKHELTRRDKEEDRMKHVRVCNANIEPVFFAYPDNEVLNELLMRYAATTPEYDFIAPIDGFRHQFWVVSDDQDIATITAEFAKMPSLYIADGHHRSAAAALVGAEKAKQNPNHTGKEEYNYFMAVCFQASQLTILDYNRVVKDLNGLTSDQFLDALTKNFEVIDIDAINVNVSGDEEGIPCYEKMAIDDAISQFGLDILKPAALHSFLLYLDGKWYIYFAGGDKDDIWAIRPYVLECADADPITGTWTEKGKMGRANEDEFSFEAFSLDATVFENKGKHYYVWAEKVGVGKQISNLYIGEMESPYKLRTVQVLLTTPDYDWERVGFWVNEGPAVIHHDGKIYLTYSASETGIAYCMGMLTADEDSDLLDPKSWTKERYPVLRTDESRGIYGPGHNSFTEDEEGNPIMVYHARTEAEIEGNPLYNPNRHAMLMKIRWDEKTGAPIFSYED